MRTSKVSELPNCIQFMNDELIVDDIPAKELTREYGTPLFIISEKQIRQNYNRLYKAFSSRYPKSLIAYSYKTNYLPAVCDILHQEGAGAEVVSGFELFLARKLGVSPSKIIFNGPGKTDQEIEMLIDEGIALVNVDSIDELDKINQIAEAKGKIVDVGIRVKPNIADFFVWPTFGLDIDRWAFEAYKRASELANINVVGMHAHIGTQICSTAPYIRSIRQMTKLMHDVNAKLGIEFEFIDIGGGFGVPGFTPLYPFEEAIGNPATIDQFAESISETLLSSISDYGLPELTLVLEPGRTIITDPVVLLTMVEGTKMVGKNTKTVMVDGGINLVQFAPYYYHRILPVTDGGGEREAVDICGPLCMQLDVLGVNRELPVLKRGDFLAVLDAGAYSISLSQQFIRPRPPVVMVGGGEGRLVRRGETFEDVFRLDVFYDNKSSNGSMW